MVACTLTQRKSWTRLAPEQRAVRSWLRATAATPAIVCSSVGKRMDGTHCVLATCHTSTVTPSEAATTAAPLARPPRTSVPGQRRARDGTPSRSERAPTLDAPGGGAVHLDDGAGDEAGA